MLRFGILLILFLFSLLTVMPAPSYHLWLSAIVVSEFSIVLIALTLVFLVSGNRQHARWMPGAILGLFAIFLYASTIIRAAFLSRNLAKQLATSFNERSSLSHKPLEFKKLIHLASYPSIEPTQLTYVSRFRDSLEMDFYPAKMKGIRPCVIVVHGGSWKSGNSSQLPELNQVLARDGYHVAAINYRLAPTFQSPAQIDDVKAAIQYLKRQSGFLSIDSSKLILLGRSAGAQIALLAAYTLSDPAIRGVVDFYGPADMVWGYSIPANPLVMDSQKVMEDYLGGTYQERSLQYAQSSPVNFVSAKTVPTLIIHGQNDVLVAYEHSIRLQKRLNQYKIKNYFLSLPWATHGFDYTLNGPGGQLSTFAVQYFLQVVTN